MYLGEHRGNALACVWDCLPKVEPDRHFFKRRVRPNHFTKQGADPPIPVPVPVPDLSGDGDGTSVPDLPGAGTLPRPRPRFAEMGGRSPVPVPDSLKSGTTGLVL